MKASEIKIAVNSDAVNYPAIELILPDGTKLLFDTFEARELCREIAKVITDAERVRFSNFR